MGYIGRFTRVARQATRLARTHQDSIERGIDKAGSFANEKTGAKHDQHIRKGSEHLRTGLSKITGNPNGPSPEHKKPEPKGLEDNGNGATGT